MDCDLHMFPDTLSSLRISLQLRHKFGDKRDRKIQRKKTGLDTDVFGQGDEFPFGRNSLDQRAEED